MNNKKPHKNTHNKQSKPQSTVGERPNAKPKNKPIKTVAPKLSGLWLYGTHSIKAALANPKRKIHELRLTDEAYASLPHALIAEQNIDVKLYAKADIAKMAPASSLHQGVMARCEPLPYQTIDDVIANLEEGEKSTIVVLDQVTDPHNVGAILRSAAIFGATAVIVPDKNAPEETGVLAKTASGALEKVNYVRSGNLKRTLDNLKDAGFWCVGFSGDSDKSLRDFKSDDRTVIIMGAESTGMRRLTKESCDHLLKIDMVGADNTLDSLNVSNAAAIALFALT